MLTHSAALLPPWPASKSSTDHAKRRSSTGTLVDLPNLARACQPGVCGIPRCIWCAVCHLQVDHAAGGRIGSDVSVAQAVRPAQGCAGGGSKGGGDRGGGDGDGGDSGGRDGGGDGGGGRGGGDGGGDGGGGTGGNDGGGGDGGGGEGGGGEGGGGDGAGMTNGV
eukprot:537113-Prymnesium_polylepis.1